MLQKVRIITSGIVMAGVAGIIGRGETLVNAIERTKGPDKTSDRK